MRRCVEGQALVEARDRVRHFSCSNRSRLTSPFHFHLLPPQLLDSMGVGGRGRVGSRTR